MIPSNLLISTLHFPFFPLLFFLCLLFAAYHGGDKNIVKRLLLHNFDLACLHQLQHSQEGDYQLHLGPLL